MEEEHKYQREMEKRELERKAQVRKGHNSLKEEELSLLIETCTVVYWSLALKFEFGIPHNKLWIIIYLLSDVNLMIPNVSLGIVVAMGICKRI